jgi:ubiquinone biosynthesis protein
LGFPLGLPPIRRYRQIFAVMARYGFADLAEELGYESLIPRSWRRTRPNADPEATRALNLRLALEELGPTYIKLGQVLSTRPDLLSSAYIKELENLQDRIPPFPSEQAKALIEAELGARIGDLFLVFYDTPLASASLSQAHEAILPDGTQVIVKVQRPDAAERVKRDIPALRGLAELFEARTDWGKLYDVTGIVKELERNLHLELNFQRERYNLETMARNMANFPRIKVPKVYPAYTSQRVLVMERVFGKKANGSIHDKALATQFLHAFLTQFAEDGFFHADPHPGNVLITEAHDLYLIDLGMVGYLDSRTRRGMTKFMLAMLGRRGDTTAEVLVELGEPLRDFQLNPYRLEIGRLVARFHNTSLTELNVGEVMTEAVRIGFKYRLRFHSQLMLLVKALTQIDGIARALDPDADLLDILRPYLPRVVADQVGELVSPMNLMHTGMEATEVALDMPRKISILLDKINADNRIRIQFEHIALQEALQPFGIWMNRLVMGIVFAALAIASAMIIASGAGPQWFGYPALGLLGFLASFVLGLYLVVTILRTHLL